MIKKKAIDFCIKENKRGFFALQEDAVKRLKRQARLRENICKSHEEWWVSKIYKEFLKQ
jgi:hypothetical protein